MSQRHPGRPPLPMDELRRSVMRRFTLSVTPNMRLNGYERDGEAVVEVHRNYAER